jgi:phage terminase large subunit GpA-like protein
VSFASAQDIRRRALSAGLRPPPKLTLSQWADEHFRLSAESAAQAGRWTCLPYQRGILDAITDPKVTQVSLMKSARIGYTLMVTAAVGYFIHQVPCSILLVQPTVEDAKGFSKETIAPMFRDVPVLSAIAFEDAEDSGPKDSRNTIQHKRFPGGVLSLVGANSGSGFRRVSRKVVIFDEVDAYPPSAGSDGDPIDLGKKRAEYFWDRKILAGSTPLVAGVSRIEQMFEEGDQRRFYVPCPHCGHRDFLVFTERADHAGHFMQWPDGKPEDAYFVCSKNGCVIDHKYKRDMVAAGEWRAAKPFKGHASFHIWAAYSFGPNTSWGALAQEFLAAKRAGPLRLQVFCNTVLGETWKEKGEAPDWERLYRRREQYPMGVVPPGVVFLTGGIDVQKDRVVWEVVGWGVGKESWSVDAGEIYMDTSSDAEWTKVDELLDRSWETSAGLRMGLLMLGIDSGYNTQMVYSWARRHVGRVIATKGVSTARVLLGTPTAVDVKRNGKRIARGCKVWPVGVDMAKSELYGWLKLDAPMDGAPYPAGYCHFPERDAEFFKQMTAEHLVTTVTRTGFTKMEWHVQQGRQNHVLDARICARAAAAQAGVDRIARKAPAPVAPQEPPPVLVQQEVAPSPPPPRPPQSQPRFLGGRVRAKGWLKR